MKVEGSIVDLIKKTISPGIIHICDKKISSIEYLHETSSPNYILPGFIDAHIHVESSLLIPSEFSRLAVCFGTVATVSDPHEIANVLGISGVEYMIENSTHTPLKIYFGIPSCVPATSFETAGATLTTKEIKHLFQTHKLKYLAEMMNYPGVINKDEEVINKIKIAKELNKPIDGHAPGLRGEEAEKYISAGISTDHECYTLEEALEKIEYGMKILIREGSAAKNFNALHPLIGRHPEKTMFCSDDKHPDDLVKGHINEHVKRAINLGYDLFDVLRCASLIPIKHYNLDVGLLQEGDPADFIIVNNLKELSVLQTYIEGECVAKKGSTFIPSVQATKPNQWNVKKQNIKNFKVAAKKSKKIRVIEAVDGELITNSLERYPKIHKGNVISDIENDVLKLTVINRYKNTPPAIAFIKNIGLKKGALVTSVAHDSHNIIAVGTSDDAIYQAVNTLIQKGGGLGYYNEGVSEILQLPVAGLMTSNDAFEVAEQYRSIKEKTKTLGVTLKDPFMTLSFMALLVIPSLKLSDKGLFDAKNFKFVNLWVDA